MVLSVLLHECAHLGVMFLFRQIPDCVSVSAFGMKIQLPTGQKLQYKHNIFISLAGPASNLLIGILAVLFAQNTLAVINFTLGCLHMLPIEPLDGGLALRSFLTQKLQPDKARKITVVTSLLLILPMATLGFLILFYTKYNFSLLALSLYLMLYLVLKQDMFTAL